MTTKPEIKANDVLYRLLRDGHIVDFNEKKSHKQLCTEKGLSCVEKNN